MWLQLVSGEERTQNQAVCSYIKNHQAGHLHSFKGLGRGEGRAGDEVLMILGNYEMQNNSGKEQKAGG